MLNLRKTTDADVTDAPDPLAPSEEYQTAQAHYAEVSAKHREMRARDEGLRLAISIAASGEGKRVPSHLHEKARPFKKLAVKRPEKVADLLADVRDEIEEHTPIYFAANEAIAAAKRRETNRLACELQPRHRAAVKAMAAALEALSRAMEHEIGARAELARLAPQPTSPNLPDMSGELGTGMMFEHDGIMWLWARRVRQLGILK